MAMSVTEEVGKQISAIKFGILSPSDIRKMSVVEIETADTYDEDGVPIPGGLMDGRLGTLEPRQRCRTCGNTATTCPGHFGHIELAVPVVHVGFAKIVHELLTVTCRDCGRILLPDEKIQEFKEQMEAYRESSGEIPKNFFEHVKREAKKNPDCPHCGRPQYPIQYVKPTTFQESLETGGSITLEAAQIRTRLERIIDDDLRLLGYDPSSARPEWMVLQVLPVPPVYVRPSITLESGIRSEDDLTHKLVDIVRINQRLRECISSGAPTLIKEELSELLQYHVTTYLDNETSGIPPSRHRSGRALKTLSQRLKGKEGRFRMNLSGKRVDFSARTVISPDPNLKVDEVGVPIEVAKKLTIPEKVTAWNLEEMKELVKNGPENYPGAVYVIRPDGRRVRLEFVAERQKVAEDLKPGFIVERHLKDGDIAIFNRQPSLHRMSIIAHRVRVLPYKTFRLHLAVCLPYNADFDGDEMNLHIPQTEEAQAEARLLMQVQSQIVSPRYGAPIIGATRDFLTASYLLTRSDTFLTKSEVGRLLAEMDYDGEIPPPIRSHPEPLWSGKQIFSLLLPKDFNFIGKASICKHRHTSLDEECPVDGIVEVRDGVLRRGIIDRNSIGAERPDSLYHRIVKEYGSAFAQDFLNKLCRLLNSFINIRGFSYAIDELGLPKEAEGKIGVILEEAEGSTRRLIEAYRLGALQRVPGKTLEESLDLHIMNELSKAREQCDRIAESCFGMDNQGAIMTRVGARGTALNIGHMTACLGQQHVRGSRIPLGYRGRTLPHFDWGDQSPSARGFIKSSFHKGLSLTEFFFHAMGGREGLVDTAVRTQQSGYMQRRLIHALGFLKVEYDGTVRDTDGNIVQFKYGEDGVDPAKSDHGKAVNVQRLVDRIKGRGMRGKPINPESLEEQLKAVEDRLPPLLIEELRSTILSAQLPSSAAKAVIDRAVEEYEIAQVEPGEASGIVAAQSIGEPGTQMTLRVFHFAGVREMDVTIGLPRLIEIVDARRRPSRPIMTIRLDEEHRKDKEKALRIAQDMVHTKVKDLMKAAQYSVNLEENSVWVELDEEAMKARGVAYEQLVDAIQIPRTSVSIEEGILKVKAQDIMEEGGLRKLGTRVVNSYVKGIPGINRTQVVWEDGEDYKGWFIQTDGSNLAKVIQIPGVDPSRTYTNDLYEILEVLGIEAARNAIIKEAKEVFEGTGGGMDVDIRHIMLVADIMTQTGELRQIGRHGVSGEKTSTLAKAAFEITVPNIVKASASGDVDELKGVTENIIVGQDMPIGTGLVDIYMSPSGMMAPTEERDEESG